ncbi:MAG TPA: glycosyltransferase [bacterium]|nr:glycosyltransferase [bacterium]
MKLLSIIFIVSFLYYLRYLYILWKGLLSFNQKTNPERPFVSIVVAARNEEETLPELLSLLINQDYDKAKYEIIIANDQSTDQTDEVVHRFQEYCDNLILVNVADPGEGVSRKKNALSQAIEQSRGEIILTTDADCEVQASWIENMVKYFTDNVGLVAGLSIPKKEARSNIVQKFEYFDMLVLFTAAAGSISSGRSFSCSGQNLAFTREAYDNVGGYGKVKNYESGDDVLLMQLISNAGYKTRFAFDKGAYNSTVSENSLLKFFNQRIRWATNERPQSLLNKEFYYYLVDVFLLNLVMIVTLFVEPGLLLGFFLIKFIFEFIVVNRGRKTFGLPLSVMKFFPVWSILHPFYVMITAIGEKMDLFRWKD